MSVIKRLRVGFLSAFVALALVACADVPEEAVTLSVTIGQDLEEVQRSHKELAIRYFKRSRDDVNRFIDDVYAPAFVSKALTEVTYEYEPNQPEMTFLPILQAEIAKLNAGEAGADPLFYMQFVVQEAVATIEQTRVDFLKPIDEREREVLRAIDDAYGKVRNAHAIVTGHLASVRRVQQVQEELLSDVGLKDIRKKFIDKAADVSDKASDLLNKARKASDSIDDLDAKIDEVKDLWNEKLK